MNLLLDTNVYIDYLGRKEPFFHNAQKIMVAGFFQDVRLWLPAQSIADAFYVLKKYVDSHRLQKAILKTLEVVNLVSLTEDDVIYALKREWEDFEDALISVDFNKVQADYLITRDAEMCKNSSIRAITPEGWLELMEEKGLVYEEVAF